MGNTIKYNTKPITKPTTAPNISRPPKPAVAPSPKNFFEELKKVILRYYKLGGLVLKESVENELNLGSLSDKSKKNITKDLPKTPDIYVSSKKTLEVANINKKITELEKKLFKKEDLENAVINIIKILFNDKKGLDVDDLNFDAKIIYDNPFEDEEASMDLPTFNKKNKKTEEDPKIKKSVEKRRLINYITQGFSFSSFEKLFEEEPSKAIDFIDNKIIKLYFDYFASMKQVNDNIDLRSIEQLVKTLEQLNSAGGINAVKSALLQMSKALGASPIQGSVRIDYDIDPEKPTIVSRGTNFITLFHETLKGIYELISHHGLKYDVETLKKIYDLTDGWVEEYRAFKFGSRVVNLFLSYFKDLENFLIKKGVIFNYNYSMAAAFLAYIYDQNHMEDGEFLEFMDGILSGEGDIIKGAEIYSTILENKSTEKEYLDEQDEEKEEGDDFIKDLIGNEKKDTDDAFSKANKNRKPTLDELLDKINSNGFSSLTEEERELLNYYSQNENFKNKRLIKLSNLLLLLEKKKKI